MKLVELEDAGAFASRHIGTTPGDQAAMLAELGYASRAALMDAIVPPAIREQATIPLPGAMTEAAALASVRGIEKVRPKGSGRYTLSLQLTEDFGMEQVTAEVLRRLLELGTTPRRLSEGSSLEAQFLKLTAKGGDGGAGTTPAA